MNYREIIHQLKNYGTAQNRKIYARHGADPENLFGVSFANLNILAKKIKPNHKLAKKLKRS